MDGKAERMSKKCDHILDYEETHCIKCLKPVWLFDNEHVLERIAELEKRQQSQQFPFNQMKQLENKVERLDTYAHREIPDNYGKLKEIQKDVMKLEKRIKAVEDDPCIVEKEKLEDKKIMNCDNCGTTGCSESGWENNACGDWIPKRNHKGSDWNEQDVFARRKIPSKKPVSHEE